MDTFCVNINVSHRASVSPSVSDVADVAPESRTSQAIAPEHETAPPSSSHASLSKDAVHTHAPKVSGTQQQKRRRLPSKPPKGGATKSLPKPPQSVTRPTPVTSTTNNTTGLQRGRSASSIQREECTSKLEPKNRSCDTTAAALHQLQKTPPEERKPLPSTVCTTPRRGARKGGMGVMTPSRSARLPAPPKALKTRIGISVSDLGCDVWQHIAQFVDPRDLANIAATSTRMRSIMHKVKPTTIAKWLHAVIPLPAARVAKEEVSGILKAWPHFQFSYECRNATSGTFFSASEKKFVQQSMVPQFSGLHKLVLTECDDFTDVSPLASVHTLCLNRCNGLVDISPLKSITKLSLEWCLNILDVSCLNNVLDLTIDRCPKVSDLSGLAAGALQRLTIRKCRNVRSLDGLARASNLTHLVLEQMHNVSNLAPVAGVQVLVVDECPSVRDISVVSHTVSQIYLRNCRNIRAPSNFATLPNVFMDTPVEGLVADGDNDTAQSIRTRSNSRMMLSAIPSASMGSTSAPLSRAESMWSLSSRNSDTSMNPEDEFDHTALHTFALIGCGQNASVESEGTPPRAAKYRMSPLSLTNSSGTSSPSSCHGHDEALGTRASTVRVRSDADDWVREARELQEANNRDRVLLEQQLNEQRDAIEQQHRLEAYEQEVRFREERELAEAEARWHFEEVHIRGADRRRCDSKKREEQRVKTKQAIEEKLQQEAATTREKLMKNQQKVDESRMQRKERIKSLMSRVKSLEGSSQRSSPVA